MVAPGNFLALSTKGDRGLFNSFFPRDNLAAAAGHIHHHCDTLGRDTWYAVASYTSANLEGNYYKGFRGKANAQALRSFWYDADISRAGDGKDPSKTYANDKEVVQWVRGFSQSTGIPLPNVWIKSGYGIHLYWVLVDALPLQEWEPYAEAFKALLVANGARGDIGITTDAARILRIPGTFNYKVPGQPAPCYIMLDYPDHPNDEVLSKLVTTSSAASLGQPSKAFTAHTSMAAAAKAGMSGPPRDLSQIASECAQVSTSDLEAGAHDGRNLWRHLLTLAHFCEDTREWAHRLGNLHPTYDEAKTDKEVDLVASEVARKGLGPPLCTTFDAERPGICPTCPHWGAIKSPASVGTPATPATPALLTTAVTPDVLPAPFRRAGGIIEMFVVRGKGKNQTKGWEKLYEGDVCGAEVTEIEGRKFLTFDHTLSGETKRVHVYHDEVTLTNARSLLSTRGVILNFNNFKPFTDLLMSWIDKLLAATSSSAARPKPLPSFGWANDDGVYAGFGVAGKFFHLDGTESGAPGADQNLISRYVPSGTLAEWQDAASFVAADVPEIHAAIAVSFGAPLLMLSGEAGGCVAFVGPSGVGKTSAFMAGASAWGNPQQTMFSLDDTFNFQAKFIGQIRALPVYWDEAKIATKDKQVELVNMLHKLTQGRDKGRLTADIKMREAGEWNTIIPLSTNNSVADMVASQDGHKSATLVRVLEIEIERRTMTPRADAAQIVAKFNRNHGHAGLVFARYIAANVLAIEAAVTVLKQRLMDATAPYENEERFYISIAACTVMGAVIAKKLGLIDLDIKGIQQVMVDAILRSREMRHHQEPISEEEQLAKVLDDFCNDNANSRVVTVRFSKPGIGMPGFGTGEPREKLPLKLDLPTPAFHIAGTDNAIRLDVQYFRDWCSRKGHPSSRLLKQMVDMWRGHYLRGIVGGGTSYHSERRNMMQISFANKAISHILDPYVEYVITPKTPKVVPIKGARP
jgi:hypothetical protein